MDFDPPKSTPGDKEPTSKEEQAFFIHFMKNDNLGRIAHAHLAHVDRNGALCSEGQELAKLHSIAVDYPKTGEPAELTRSLIPSKYPHYMQKHGKDKYHSESILGILHDKIERIDLVRDKDPTPETLSLDSSLLIPEIEGYEVYLDEARNLLQEYNYKLWIIMDKYEISSEAQVLSGYIQDLQNNHKKDKGNADQEKLTHLVKKLTQSFTNVFWVGFPPEMRDKYKDVGALKKAFAWYKVTYSQEEEYSPLLSFAWLPYKALCELKRRSKQTVK
uniref:RNA-dependent RNA polymerase n=1 Tax=Arcella intermedia TaxID=1963864 RepID=A0A6B2LDB0_9EUKA